MPTEQVPALLLALGIIALMIVGSYALSGARRLKYRINRGYRLVCARHRNLLGKGNLALVVDKKLCMFCKKHVDETQKMK